MTDCMRCGLAGILVAAVVNVVVYVFSAVICSSRITRSEEKHEESGSIRRSSQED